jgi:hypothetical protein
VPGIDVNKQQSDSTARHWFPSDIYLVRLPAEQADTFFIKKKPSPCISGADKWMLLSTTLYPLMGNCGRLHLTVTSSDGGPSDNLFGKLSQPIHNSCFSLPFAWKPLYFQKHNNRQVSKWQ